MASWRSITGLKNVHLITTSWIFTGRPGSFKNAKQAELKLAIALMFKMLVEFHSGLDADSQLRDDDRSKPARMASRIA